MSARTVLAPLGLALALGLAALGGWFGRESTLPPPPAPGTLPAMDSLASHTLRLRAALARLEPASPAEDAALRRPATPSYREHLRWADSLGVRPVADEAGLARLVAAGRLVPLAETDRYAVRVLEHSKPFVTPETLAMVDGVGKRFQAELRRAGLPRYRPVVTSALRTADLQRALGQTNRNATPGRSSHEFGVSIDFDYSDFALWPTAADSLRLPAADASAPHAQRLAVEAAHDFGRVYAPHLAGALTRVLLAVQREGRALVLSEPEQPVFHLTVRRPERARRPSPPPDSSPPPDTLDDDADPAE